MALFGLGSKKQKTVSTQKIRPTVVRTQNVAKELARIAAMYDVQPEQLDFTLLNVQSYIRMNEDLKEGEWEEVANEALLTLDESQLLSENFEIKQTYEIEIFSKGMQEDPLETFFTSVGANATKCKIYLSVNNGSKLEYFPRVSVELEELIEKKKIRAGILIRIFDEMVEDFISKITAHLKVEGALEYEKSQTYLIAQGFEPTATTHDALILHYEKKEQPDEKTKIDYAARGFIQSVRQGEVLIEYIKPRMGKPGRNCKGEFLQPQEPIEKNQPTFSVDESIKVVETPESIKYIARENGYIALEGTTYTIKNEVDVSEVSFKTTGSIYSGKDSDVNMSVKEKDAIKDAVGTGMTVEVSTIEVDGNVGSNARVIANKANIGGQTHKTAYVEADQLSINVHKGHAKGKDVHITRLEHGKVEAQHADISQALGGTIVAREIDIEVCASHVKATASKRIEIQKLHGSENKFIIDPLLQDDISEGVQENEEKLKKLEAEIEELKKDIKKYELLLTEGKSAFLDIKKRLVHYKKKGIKLPGSFVKKYKQYQQMQEHYNFSKNELKAKEDMVHLLNGKISAFQDNIMDARVINKDRWKGYNEIIFKLIDPPIELVYKPKEGSQEKVFGLVEVDENEFIIEAIKE